MALYGPSFRRFATARPRLRRRSMRFAAAPPEPSRPARAATSRDAGPEPRDVARAPATAEVPPHGRAVPDDARRDAEALVAVHEVVARVFSVVALGALALAIKAPPLRGEALSLSLLGAAIAWVVKDRARGIVRDGLVGAARNELSRGSLDAADRIAAAIDLERGAAVVAGLRAETSLARGDARRAVDLLRGALAPTPGRDAARARPDVLWLRSALALASALAGDADAALAEVALVRRTVARRAYGEGEMVTLDAVKHALARAALAEIVVASRASGGRFDGARVESLASDARRLVLDAVCPRERALFRALERMARAKVASVYRAPELPPEAEESTPSAWVARIVPDAAPFTSSARAAGAPRGSDDAVTLDRRRPSRGLAARAALRLAVAAGVAVLACSALLAAVRDPRRPADPVHVVGLAAVVVVIAAVVVTVRARRSRRVLAAANDVFSRAATCPPGVARALLIALETADAPPVVDASKEIALARIARGTGDFTAALAHAERASRALERGVRPLDAIGTRAQASAERALALALLGRADEARAIVSDTTRLFAGHTALVALVAVYAALARGDLDAARAAASSLPENLTLDRRSELVVDLLRATSAVGGLGLAADERLRAELDEPSARAFVDAVAPALVRAFDGGDSPPATASPEG